MALYEIKRNAENHVKVDDALRDAVVMSNAATVDPVARATAEARKKAGRRVVVAFDGWHDVPWKQIVPAVTQALAGAGLKVRSRSGGRRVEVA